MSVCPPRTEEAEAEGMERLIASSEPRQRRAQVSLSYKAKALTQWSKVTDFLRPSNLKCTKDSMTYFHLFLTEQK